MAKRRQTTEDTRYKLTQEQAFIIADGLNDLKRFSDENTANQALKTASLIASTIADIFETACKNFGSLERRNFIARAENYAAPDKIIEGEDE